MYRIGDLVVYGSTGVCRVQNIGPAPGGGARAFYTLKPLYQTCTIYAPVEGGQVFMRPVISRAEAEALVASIPEAAPQACAFRDLRQLTEHYEAAIRSQSCTELLALSMSIYRKKQEAAVSRRRLGQTDERFMKRAEELLFGELAVALDIPVGQVADYISARVAAAEK